MHLYTYINVYLKRHSRVAPRSYPCNRFWGTFLAAFAGKAYVASYRARPTPREVSGHINVEYPVKRSSGEARHAPRPLSKKEFREVSRVSKNLSVSGPGG